MFDVTDVDCVRSWGPPHLSSSFLVEEDEEAYYYLNNDVTGGVGFEKLRYEQPLTSPYVYPAYVRFMWLV